MKSAVVIRHVAFEDLGAFEPAITRAGYVLHHWNVGEQELWTLEPVKIDLLIVLGGPIGAYEDGSNPFLSEGITILEQRLDAGRPTMGVCLGAHFIARAAGASGYPSGVKEIGFAPISLTDAGRASCLAPFADDPVALHWHGDPFDLPAGATHLASTELYRTHAFAIGLNVVGFQYHPEAGVGGFEKWLVGHACELAVAGLDVVRFRQDAAAHGPALARKADQVTSHSLAGLRA